MARVTTAMAAALAGRIMELRAKLSARDGKHGFKRNCQRIRAEIARLEGAQQTQSATAEEASHG